MNRFSLMFKTAASLLLVGVLAACGSSDDAAPAAPAAPAPTTFTVAGTAATGAALDGATITITDAAGNTYPAAGETAVVTGTDGSYTITLPLTATPPFVVTAVKNDVSLVSVVAEATDTTANVTPVTTLIASRLSSSGDPSKLAAEIQADPTLVDLAKVTAKVAEIVALIQPLMDAVGTTADPLNGDIQADVTAGTGADKVLDSLSITITPSSATAVNIEVAVKQQQAEDEQPAVVTFTGGEAATAPTALPTVDAAKLIPSGTAALIADLLKRGNACYALPLASRVTGQTAADIVAPECKDIFLGNDPTSYLNNGEVAMPGSRFDGIFNNTGDGETFDRGSYEFTRQNGDLVISLRSTDRDGNVLYPTLVTRIDADGKLRVIGNQYKYSGGVNPYMQLRTFINVAGGDYYSTGYNLTVANEKDSGGNSIFEKVVVTSPKGGVLTLLPSDASNNLVLEIDGCDAPNTNYVRIRSVYVDPANTNDPRYAERCLKFGRDRTDEEIVAIPAQATWKFDYYLAGNTTTTPDETQYYKTKARALSIAELKAKSLANIIQSDIDSAKSELVIPAGQQTRLPLDTGGTIDFSWEVPATAVPPTQIKAFGRYDSLTKSFNDQTNVKSTDRTGTIVCSPAGPNDLHCDAAAGGYAADTYLNGVHLWAKDADARDFAHFYAFYTIDPTAVAQAAVAGAAVAQ